MEIQAHKVATKVKKAMNMEEYKDIKKQQNKEHAKFRKLRKSRKHQWEAA